MSTSGPAPATRPRTLHDLVNAIEYLESETYPSSFFRFLELPQEIQMLVWKFAAEPERVFILNHGLLYNIRAKPRTMPEGFFTITSCHNITSIMSTRVRMLRSDATCEKIAQRRTNLMATCALSRQMMLELWYRDVKAINVLERPLSFLCEGRPDLIAMLGTGQKLSEVKAEVLQFLTGLINAIKRTPNRELLCASSTADTQITSHLPRSPRSVCEVERPSETTRTQ